jgi:hypothetical protein
MSAEVRTVYMLAQKFPLDSSVQAEWKEHTEVTGDDLETGKPSTGHGYYLVNTWDCAGPASAAAFNGVPCVPTDGPTYHDRLRHKTEHTYDDKLKSWVDTDASYDYDQYGNETHSLIKTTDDSEEQIAEVTRIFAAPDFVAWFVDKPVSTKTVQSTTKFGKDKSRGETTTTEKNEQFEFNTFRDLSRVTTRDQNPYPEIKSLTYRDDPTVADYGNLVAVSISHVNPTDGSVEDLKSVHIEYTPDGYFPINYKDTEKTEESNTFDPMTGMKTKQVKDGVTDTQVFDPFGRETMEQEVSDKKPLRTINISYVPCDSKCPKNAVYYKLYEVEGHTVKTTWYNLRNEALNPD